MATASVEKFKSWLTPGLVTCFGMLLWNLFTEIRTDIKTLLAANAETQVRIQALEKRMDGIENVVYAQRMFALKPEEIEVPKRNTRN